MKASYELTGTEFRSMMGLTGRIQARQTAPFHLQIELEKGRDDVRVPSNVLVRGRVVRVFGSDGRLAAGKRVTFNLWVCRRGDEPTVRPYIYYDKFVQATHMELYLRGNPPNCQLAAYEFTVLNAPSDEPSMSVHDLHPLVEFEDPHPTTDSGKKWWQLWKSPPAPAKKPADWIAKLDEPFFHTREEVEQYVARELYLPASEGWRIIRPPGNELTWIIEKTRLEPGDADSVDYCLHVSRGLDLIVLTYGNNDKGMFSLGHVLQNGVVIETPLLREFSLRECLSFLFSQCKPNQRNST